MRYFPIFLDIQKQPILVIGGGLTALAKLRLLGKTEALVTIISDEVIEDVAKWAKTHNARVIKQIFCISDLDHLDRPRAVYVATENEQFNIKVAEEIRSRNILVNVVDTPAHCDFITPAIVDRDPLVVAIGTEGKAPVLARKIKRELEEKLPQSLKTIVQTAAILRNEVADKLEVGKPRRIFWSKVFSDKMIAFFSGKKTNDITIKIRELLEHEEDVTLDSSNKNVDQEAKAKPSSSKIYFVGAGPGNAELLTIKAVQCLDIADVVIYDRLVGADVLEFARREAFLVDVGKTPNKKSISQQEICEKIIHYASQGLSVVRLKGGDPSVFGRLDEELDAVRNHGFDYEVIPGITAASAAAAAIGVSLTNRSSNSAVSFITAHSKDGPAEHDWRYLAKPNARALVYMGLGQARYLQGKMLLAGAKPEKNITIVENASLPEQNIIETSLGELPAAIIAANIESPSILLIGYSPADIQILNNDIQANFQIATQLPDDTVSGIIKLAK